MYLCYETAAAGLPGHSFTCSGYCTTVIINREDANMKCFLLVRPLPQNGTVPFSEILLCAIIFARLKNIILHRRRIKTEEKAKVVAALWGAELIQFLATLAILHTDDLKNRMNCTRTI